MHIFMKRLKFAAFPSNLPNQKKFFGGNNIYLLFIYVFASSGYKWLYVGDILGLYFLQPIKKSIQQYSIGYETYLQSYILRYTRKYLRKIQITHCLIEMRVGPIPFREVFVKFQRFFTNVEVISHLFEGETKRSRLGDGFVL